MDFQRLPKVETHLHLDCSLSYDVVRRLDPSVTPEEFRQEFVAPPKTRNLADFLTRAVRQFTLMQDEWALRLVVADLFEQLARDNVIYAEFRFAPLLHLQKGLTPRAVVEAVEDEARRASDESGIDGRVILCTLRHFTAEQSMETARLVEAFAGSRVVALDIAGDEAGHPLAPHVPAFTYVAERGLYRTAHAGEAAGPASVWETLRQLHPLRIGHGVRSSEDPDLVEHLRESRIHLETCPTSNVQTNMYETLADHPLPSLFNHGLSTGVNCDCRTISDITLTEEYRRLHDTFGWGEEELLRCNVHALESAFIPEEEKWPLRERLLAGYRSEQPAG